MEETGGARKRYSTLIMPSFSRLEDMGFCGAGGKTMISVVLEKGWKSPVARGGERSVGPECRITDAWEEKPECVDT